MTPSVLGYENLGFEDLKIIMGKGVNDGVVPVSTVKSMPNSTSLGYPHDCHTNLFSDKEFELAEEAEKLYNVLAKDLVDQVLSYYSVGRSSASLPLLPGSDEGFPAKGEAG